MDGETMAEAVQRLYTRNYSSSMEFINTRKAPNFPLFPVAATGILLADYLATYEAEFAYIWKKPVTSVKVTFLLARYLAIFGQVTNCYLLLRIISPDRIPIDEKICRRAVNYQVVVALCLHVLSDSILVRRVAGLYSYHRLVRYGLIAILVAQIVGWIIGLLIEQPNVNWTIACEIKPSSFSFPGMVFSTVLVISHGLIWFLTTSRRRVSFSIIFPFTRMSLRDGAWAALIYVSIFLSVTPYSLLANSFRTELQLAWPTTLISILACRLILNTREESLDDYIATYSDILLDDRRDTCKSLGAISHDTKT